MWKSSSTLLFFFLSSSLVAAWSSRSGWGWGGQQVFSHGSSSNDDDDNTKVPVTLAVMSKCPDGIYCETQFSKVLDQVSDIVSLHLEYIGELVNDDGDDHDKDKDDDDDDGSGDGNGDGDEENEYGVRCMHGPEECKGNVQQLCLQQIYDQDKWWEILQCINYEPRSSIGQESLLKKCISTAKQDYEEDGVKECVEGEKGGALLRQSVRWTKEMGIKKSCSILINGELVCIRDGTWKECPNGHTTSEFVDQIQKKYKEINNGST